MKPQTVTNRQAEISRSNVALSIRSMRKTPEAFGIRVNQKIRRVVTERHVSFRAACEMSGVESTLYFYSR